MRLTLTLLAFVLAAFPVTAQTDYKTIADSTSLTDSGTLADVQIDCMDQLANGTFVFYNDATGDLAIHDPATGTSVLRSNAQIDSDLAGDAQGCFAITSDSDSNVYAALQDTSGVDMIYKTDGSSGTSLAADGITGLALSNDESTLYIARVEFFGAPEDGFYSTDAATLSSVGTVLLDAGLDLIDVAVGSDGSLYSSSSRFGSTGAGFRNVVVKVTDPEGSPALSVVYDPYGDGIFGGGTNDLEDLELRQGSPDRLYLYNNSFAAAEGEQWGTVLADGTGGERIADQAALLADTGLGGYTSTAGRQMTLSADGDEIYVGSRDSFGGDDAIVQMANFPPVRNLDIKVSGVPPIVTPGSSFTVNYVVFNNLANPATGDLFYTISPGNIRATVVSGTVPANSSFSNSYTQNVPAVAPAGTYTYTVRIGNAASNVTVASESFSVRVVPAAGSVSEGTTDWSVSDVTPWPEEAAEVASRTADASVGAYPNPFARQTEIAFSLERASDVSLVIYDVRGREVVTLADGTMDAGQHRVTFDAASLPSGVYVYRLVSGTQVETGRVTLVK